MKIHRLTSFLGLAVLLNGCATSGKIAQDQGDSRKGVMAQVQAFTGLGDMYQTPTGFTVGLSGDALFKIGRSRLSADGIQKVDGIAAVLARYPSDLVTISDYTDSSGAPERNLRLSQRRADSVKDEMISKGVPVDNVSAVGKGDLDPVASNDTPEDRARNRRVVIGVTLS